MEHDWISTDPTAIWPFYSSKTEKIYFTELYIKEQRYILFFKMLEKFANRMYSFFFFLSHLAAKGNEVHLSRRLQYWTISSVKPELPFSFHPASYSPYNSTHPWNCQPQNSVSQAVEVALVSTGHVVTCSPRALRQACLRGTTIMSSALRSCCRWASRTGRDVIASSLTFGGSLEYQACNEVHHEHNRGCCHQRQMMWIADDRQRAAN